MKSNNILNAQKMVEEFMDKAEQYVPLRPTLLDKKTQELRIDLIQEEFDEYKEGVEEQNLTKIADGLADMLYVIIGAASAHGLNLEPLFNEVHRSNMSKFIDGHKAENGKWIKGPSYSPADFRNLILEQRYGK